MCLERIYGRAAYTLRLFGDVLMRWGMEVNGNRMRNGELYKLGFSRNFSLFFLPYILSTVHSFNDFVLRLSSSNTTHTPPHIRDFKEIFHFHLGRW